MSAQHSLNFEGAKFWPSRVGTEEFTMAAEKSYSCVIYEIQVLHF